MSFSPWRIRMGANWPRAPASRQGMLIRTLIATLLVLTASGAFAILDQNANQQSDIWESAFSAIALNASVDTDKDGFSNLQESIAGTNPLDANSKPTLQIAFAGVDISVGWPSVPGKRYTFASNDTFDPVTWQTAATLDGTGAGLALLFANSEGQHFFRLQVQDLDTDADGLTDTEEYTLGFNPNSAHTDRYDQTDMQRVSRRLEFRKHDHGGGA